MLRKLERNTKKYFLLEFGSLLYFSYLCIYKIKIQYE